MLELRKLKPFAWILCSLLCLPPFAKTAKDGAPEVGFLCEKPSLQNPGVNVYPKEIPTRVARGD